MAVKPAGQAKDVQNLVQVCVIRARKLMLTLVKSVTVIFSLSPAICLVIPDVKNK